MYHDANGRCFGPIFSWLLRVAFFEEQEKIKGWIVQRDLMLITIILVTRMIQIQPYTVKQLSPACQDKRGNTGNPLIWFSFFGGFSCLLSAHEIYLDHDTLRYMLEKINQFQP